MAPRKTTKTAADTPNAEDAVLAAVSQKIEKMGAEGIALIEEVERQTYGSVRFQVALAVFPELVMSAFPKIDDENQAGMAARMAFEFADAFIAQSKKRDYDAG